MACGISSKHLQRIHTWCIRQKTPRNCDTSSYCFGGVMLMNIDNIHKIAWSQFLAGVVQGMVRDYGPRSYPLAEQTILNRIWARHKGVSGAIDSSWNCVKGKQAPFLESCNIHHYPGDYKQVNTKVPFGECNQTSFWRHDFPTLRSRKRSDAALLIGNGPSANLVTESNAKYISRLFDVWATNQFFVHNH